MEYNDSMRKFRDALEKKFDKGFEDGQQREFLPGATWGCLRSAYSNGYHQAKRIRRLSVKVK